MPSFRKEHAGAEGVGRLGVFGLESESAGRRAGAGAKALAVFFLFVPVPVVVPLTPVRKASLAGLLRR